MEEINKEKQETAGMSKKVKKELTVIGLVVALICFAAGYTLWKTKHEGQIEMVYTEYEVQQGTLKSVVTESGSVTLGTTAQIYDLDITTDDDEDDDDEDDEEEEKYLKVAEVYAAVGQRISEGDKVYRFTQDSIDDVRKALTYEVTEAQIALNEAQTSYDIGVLQAELTRSETMLDTALAQETYDNTIARLSNDMAAKSLEIEQLLGDIYNLQLTLVDEDYLDRKQSIVDAYEGAKDDLKDASEDFVTNQVEAAAAFREARDSYESFFEQLDETNEDINDKIEEIYEKQEEIVYDQQLLEKELLAAQQELTSSNISGAIADTKYQSSLTSYESALRSAQTTLSEAQEKLEDFNEFVGDGTVYAKGSGIVTEVGYEVDDYLVNTGVLIAFAEAKNMTISVDVSQEDVVTMKVGDSVDIAFSAYEGESYTGTVESITTTATSRSSATISYPVIISIQGDTAKLYGGMTADVTFTTQEAADVTYISAKAVVKENGRSYVYVEQNGKYVLTPVTTDFSNGEYIEVTSGLNTGDKYYICVQAESAAQKNEEAREEQETKETSRSEGEKTKPADRNRNMEGNRNEP